MFPPGIVHKAIGQASASVCSRTADHIIEQGIRSSEGASNFKRIFADGDVRTDAKIGAGGTIHLEECQPATAHTITLTTLVTWSQLETVGHAYTTIGVGIGEIGFIGRIAAPFLRVTDGDLLFTARPLDLRPALEGVTPTQFIEPERALSCLQLDVEPAIGIGRPKTQARRSSSLLATQDGVGQVAGRAQTD